MQSGGSIVQTKKMLKEMWGYAPTEPTLRKWLQSSTEALNLLDQRTAANLQSDIAHIIELSYDLLVKELEEGSFPVAKLGTLYGIMIDKFIMLNKVRNESAKSASKDIIADELYSDKSDLLNALEEYGEDVLDSK